MKLVVEDEVEGDVWAGYVTVRAEVDGVLLLEAEVATELVPDVDEFADLIELVAEVEP